jgi:hypothetical protein
VLKILHGMTDSVIQSKKSELKLKEKISDTNAEEGAQNRCAFLDLLLQTQMEQGDCMTDGEIKDEVNSLMFGVKYHCT